MVICSTSPFATCKAARGRVCTDDTCEPNALVVLFASHGIVDSRCCTTTSCGRWRREEDTGALQTTKDDRVHIFPLRVDDSTQLSSATLATSVKLCRYFNLRGPDVKFPRPLIIGDRDCGVCQAARLYRNTRGLVEVVHPRYLMQHQAHLAANIH